MPHASLRRVKSSRRHETVRDALHTRDLKCILGADSKQGTNSMKHPCLAIICIIALQRIATMGRVLTIANPTGDRRLLAENRPLRIRTYRPFNRNNLARHQFVLSEINCTDYYAVGVSRDRSKDYRVHSL